MPRLTRHRKQIKKFSQLKRCRMTSRQNTPLGLKRSRPTDATGLFWAFVSLVVGVFMYLAGISPHVFAIILIALIICISWQIRIWADHRAKLQVARAWCEQFYPKKDVTIILDFAFALAIKMSSDLKNHTPATLIENVNWITHDEWTEYYHPEYNSPTSVWLEEVLADARITDVDINHFEGDTLGDIFTFIIRASKMQMSIFE